MPLYAPRALYGLSLCVLLTPPRWFPGTNDISLFNDTTVMRGLPGPPGSLQIRVLDMA